MTISVWMEDAVSLVEHTVMELFNWDKILPYFNATAIDHPLSIGCLCTKSPVLHHGSRRQL